MHSARLFTALLLLVGFLSTAAADDRTDELSRTDADGDPLPRGAIARLGSARWRLPYEPRGFFLSPDGRTLAVTTNHLTTELFDATTGKRLRSLGKPGISYWYGPVPASVSPDGKVIAHLDTSNGLPVLRIYNLGEKRERSISFRTKDAYRPPAELSKQKILKRVGGSEDISALAFSSDGKVLAAAVRFQLRITGAKDRVFVDLDENSVRGWEVASGKELFVCTGHATKISAVFFSPNTKTLTTASEDGTVRFWDTATGKENRRRWKADGPLFCAASSPDGKWFAAGSKKMVLLWDIATGDVRDRFAIPTNKVRSLAFTPGSDLLAASGESVLRLWEPRSARMVRETSALPHPVEALAFSADGKTLFLGHDGEHVVRRRDVATLAPFEQLSGHATPIDFLGFTTDDRQILTFDSADEGFLWDVDTGKPHPIRKEDEKRIERLWLASVGRVAPLYSTPDYEGPFRFGIVPMNCRFELSENPQLIACSTDGKRLLVARKKEKPCELMILDQRSGTTLWQRAQQQGEGNASLSPDGRMLALAASNRLTFLDVDSGRSRQYAFATETVMYHTFSVHPKFSPDGSRLALLGNEKVQVVSVRDGRLLAVIIPEAGDRLVGLSFSADGKTLCLSRFDGPQTIWEVASGQLIRSDSGQGCLFSPGNHFVAIRKENALVLHELHSGKIFRTCRDATGFADSFLFSSDDTRLATASQDTTVLLWDTATPESAAQPTALDETTLDRLWIELEIGRAAVAYAAMGRLIADPQQSLPMLCKHLRQVPPVEEKRLRQWIADLDSDSFEKREAASRQLGQLGAAAESALRKALTESTSLEMRRRIQDLLRPFEAKEIRLSAEELAHVRAIQVLECIATAEARQLLKHLAEGAEGVVRTRDAQEALQRIRRRGQ